MGRRVFVDYFDLMTDVQLPSRIDIICTIARKPQAGLLACITLKMRRKNDFHIWIGPTDSHGKASITKADILQQAHEDIKLAQMDYGSPEADFSGEIETAVVNVGGIDRALSAYDLFKNYAKYPRNWKTKLDQARKVLMKLPADTQVKLITRKIGRKMRKMRDGSDF